MVNTDNIVPASKCKYKTSLKHLLFSEKLNYTNSKKNVIFTKKVELAIAYE